MARSRSIFCAPGPASRTRRFRTVCASGHVGRAGEQWLVRVLPPPTSHFDYHVAFTSPYVIELPGETEWRSFFRRTLLKTSIDDDKAAYKSLMKHGLGPSTKRPAPPILVI